MMQSDFDRLLSKTRKRVAAMDATDGGQQPPEMLARTAMFAIRSSLLTSDTACLFDAIVYLEQLTGTTLT